LADARLTRLRRKHIGFVFQFFNLLPMLTAEENVVLPLAIAGEKPDKGWLDELLGETGLSDRRTHRPSELSGGQQQRVAIAVALISGTYVLTDTIKAAFSTVFAQVYKNTDAVITGESAIGGNQNDGVVPPSLPESLLAQVRSLPGVAVAEGGVNDEARLVNHKGKVISRGGSPNLAFSVDPKGDQRFNPLVLTEGHW